MKEKYSTFIDQKSGNEIIQWTDSDMNDQHLYFTSPSVTDDNQYLVILSEREGKPDLFCIDRNSREILKITNSKGLLKSYTYPQGAKEGLSKASPFLDSKNKILYWIEDDCILRKSLVSSEAPKKITCLPKGWLTGYTHVSSDGKKICIPCTDPKAFTEGDKTQHDQLKSVPMRMSDEGYKTKIIVVDIESGAYDAEVELPFWVTHVQFDPNYSDKILCNSEGSLPSRAKRNFPYWGRIWLVNTDGSYRRLFEQEEGVYVNHENWFRNGEGIVYHGKYNQSFLKKAGYYGMIAFNKFVTKMFSRRKLDLMFDHFVAVSDVNGKELIKVKINHPVSHAVAGAQGKNFVVDSRDGNIYGYKEDKDFKKSLICYHGSSLSFQDAHPHPRISKKGNRVIFTSDKNGSCNVYEVKLKEII